MESSYTPTLTQALAMAREMLLDKYTEAKNYQIFLWRMSDGTGMMPDVPTYPTEEEIIALAKQLWEFFNGACGNVAVEPTMTTTTTAVTAGNLSPGPNVCEPPVTSITVI